MKGKIPHKLASRFTGLKPTGLVTLGGQVWRGRVAHQEQDPPRMAWGHTSHRTKFDSEIPKRRLVSLKAQVKARPIRSMHVQSGQGSVSHVTTSPCHHFTTSPHRHVATTRLSNSTVLRVAWVDWDWFLVTSPTPRRPRGNAAAAPSSPLRRATHRTVI